MRIKKYALKSLATLGVLAVGVSVGTLVFSSASSYRNESLAPVPQYEKNASGMTYGSSLYATSKETEPDLVKAYGVDGTLGYVRATDLNGIQPKTPEEALAQQAKLDAAGIKKIHLYDKDGKTVIGEFNITPGKVTEKKSN